MKESQRIDLFRVIEIISYLKEIDLFHDIPANYLAGLAEMAKEQIWYEEDYLFVEGDLGDAFYIILEGDISIEIGGNEIGCLTFPECIGEMALLDGEARSASAKVKSAEARVLSIDSDDFDDFLTTYPSLARSLLKTLVQRLRSTSVRVPK